MIIKNQIENIALFYYVFKWQIIKMPVFHNYSKSQIAYLIEDDKILRAYPYTWEKCAKAMMRLEELER